METDRWSPAGTTLREPYASGVDLQGPSAFREELRRMLHEMRATKTGRTLFARLAQVHAARGHVAVILSSETAKEPEVPTTFAMSDGPGPLRAHRDPKTARVIVDEPGRGASPVVFWDRRFSANQVFSPIHGKYVPSSQLADCTPLWVCLGHELIHALHTMEGVALHAFFETDPLSGKEETEEFATVGLGPYRDDPLTENAFHAELGSARRWSYARTCFLRRSKPR